MERYYILAICIVWGVCGFIIGKYQERNEWNNLIMCGKLPKPNSEWYNRTRFKQLYVDFLQEFLEDFCKLHNIHWLDNKTQEFVKKHKLYDDERNRAL